MLCDHCLALFCGELTKSNEDLNVYEKRDQYYVSLASSNGCKLCHLIRARIRRRILQKGQVQEEDTLNADILIDRKLKFMMDPRDARRNVEASLTGYFSSSSDEACALIFYKPERSERLSSSEVTQSTTTDSGETFQLARTWLFACVSTHGDCKVDKSCLELPSRLLFLDAANTHQIRLLETATLTSVPTYMTLSHCWGDAKFLTLTEATYGRLRGGINVSELPRTFQDAVRTALQLGAKYLWIDSLCILQDSKEDWQKEAPLMSAIYQGSLCNIAAASSKNSDAGCFHSRDPTLLEPFTVTTCYNNEHIDAEYAHLHEKDDDGDYENQQPLFSRGWVFQERFLAPRMLGFTAEYAFWRCKTIETSEKNLMGLGYNYVFATNIFVQNREDNIHWWTKALALYSSLLLTKASDKLVAISGIAKILHSLDPSNKYIAGLWQSNMLQGTLHTSHYPKSSSGSKSRPPEDSRGLSYRAPAWSWASLDGSMTYEMAHTVQWGRALCTVESVTLYHTTADIYGELLHANLIIKGQLLKCENLGPNTLLKARAFRHYLKNLVLAPLGSVGSTATYSAFFHTDTNLGVDGIAKGTTYLLPILEQGEELGIGLILLRTGRARYERCGVFDSLSVKSSSEHTFVQSGKGVVNETILEEKFWETLAQRTARREEARKSAGLEPFEVTYLVGPPPPEDENALQHGEEEYEEFDGEDYVFSLI